MTHHSPTQQVVNSETCQSREVITQAAAAIAFNRSNSLAFIASCILTLSGTTLCLSSVIFQPLRLPSPSSFKVFFSTKLYSLSFSLSKMNGLTRLTGGLVMILGIRSLLLLAECS